MEDEIQETTKIIQFTEPINKSMQNANIRWYNNCWCPFSLTVDNSIIENPLCSPVENNLTSE